MRADSHDNTYTSHLTLSGPFARDSARDSIPINTYGLVPLYRSIVFCKPQAGRGEKAMEKRCRWTVLLLVLLLAIAIVVAAVVVIPILKTLVMNEVKTPLPFSPTDNAAFLSSVASVEAKRRVRLRGRTYPL